MKQDQVITIINSQGKTEEVELIDNISLENNNYIIVSPMGSDVAYAYRTNWRNGEVEYQSLSSGPEFDKVLAEYNKG